MLRWRDALTAGASSGPLDPVTGEHARPAGEPPEPLPEGGGTPEHLGGLPRPGAGAAWPVAGAALLALLALRALRAPVHAGEGVLGADGYLAATGAGLPGSPVAPESLAALHAAGYAELTRAFTRDSALASAGRELLATATLATAALLWVAARRVGLTAGTSTAVALLWGLPVLLAVADGLETPALLATAWLSGGGCLLLASGRFPRAGPATAAVLAVPAMALAPDTAVLVLAGAAVALAQPRRRGWPWRWLPAALAVGAAVAVAVAVRVLGIGDAPAAPGLPRAALPVAGALALLVAAAAARALPVLRPLAAAVAVAAVAGLVPPARAAAVVGCLPGAALLAGALAERALAGRLPERGRLIVAAAAGTVLAGLAAAALAVPLGGPPPGDRPQRALLGWARAQLVPGARLVAPRLPAAELRHAGAPPGGVLLDGTGSGAARVTEGGEAILGRPLARFSGDGGTLTAADPSRGVPTAAELARRHQLADAVLANPTTQAPAPVRQVLRSADVDPRLLSLLAALAAQSGVGLAAFPPVPGELGTVPARRALVSSVGGVPLTPGSADTDDLLLWLGVQRPPYRPDSVTVTAHGVLVAFRYTSAPDALVTGATR